MDTPNSFEDPTGPKKYIVLAAPCWHQFALNLEVSSPKRFKYYPSKWEKFPDSQMDNIEIGGFTPENRIMNSHVLFLASFHNNDAMLSQFQVLVVLCESFIKSLTVFLPFYPVGTMERVLREGQVATASTYARMISSLPGVGRPSRIMIYDVHTLQNRFYFHGHAIASLHSAIPLLKDHLKLSDPETLKKLAIAFPDEGAAKRFGNMFPGADIIVCAKVRIGKERRVHIQDGDPAGKDVLIVDDLVRSGGTLVKCGQALKAGGAKAVFAYCSHCGGTSDHIRNFMKDGKYGNAFEKLYITNSVPSVFEGLDLGDKVEVIDLMPQLLKDL